MQYVVDYEIGAEDADFSDSFHDFIAALEALGFSFQIPQTDEDEHANVQRWLWGTGGVAVHDDFDTGVRHLSLFSESDELFQTAESTLLAHFPVQSHESLRDAYDAEPSPTLLVKLALTSSDPPSKELSVLVRAALEHEQPEMRARAAYAISFLGEDDFERVLKARRQREADPIVLAAIGRALEQ